LWQLRLAELLSVNKDRASEAKQLLADAKKKMPSDASESDRQRVTRLVDLMKRGS
jgi:hypothetical protein